MILLKVLEHDLHRSRKADAVPQTVHTPAVSDFIPAIVSTSRGKFVATRLLFTSGEDRFFKPPDGPPVLKRGGRVVAVSPDERKLQLYLASNVFSHSSDRIDQVVGDLFRAAFELSSGDRLGNVFRGKTAMDRAFLHVQRASGMTIQPHVCLYPETWDPDKAAAFFGKGYDAKTRKFRRFCRAIATSVDLPVFLSRPDMVGMYTQFMGGGASIALHNVPLGMAFCRP